MQAALHRRRTAAASCSESPPGPARLDMMSRVAAPPACWWRESTLLLVLHGHRHEPLRWPEPSTHGRATRASRRAGQPVPACASLASLPGQPVPACASLCGARCAGAIGAQERPRAVGPPGYGAARMQGRGWPQHERPQRDPLGAIKPAGPPSSAALVAAAAAAPRPPRVRRR